MIDEFSELKKDFNRKFVKQRYVDDLDLELFWGWIIENFTPRASQLEPLVGMQKAEGTYTLTFVCANCHKKFSHKFPKGYEAKQLGFGDYHFIRKPEDSQYDNVECPNCGCTNINKDWEQ